MKLLCLLLGLNLFLTSRAISAPSATPGFEQRIGQTLPLDTGFRDEQGVVRPLRDYFGRTPVVLYFNYFRCPQLCSVVADGVLDGLRRLNATVGRNLTVISISIDPTDTAAAALIKQKQEVGRYGRKGAAAGWHTLTGDAAAIKAMTDAAGFHFTYDSRSRLFGHASGLVIVTPEGVVSRYFLGVNFPAPELAAAVERAASNRTGEPVFNLLLLCLQGGSPTGPYGRLIWLVLSISVGLTVI
ncbi:MAG: SCO family protein, partial [Opitutaceae bacterium]